MFFTSFLVPLVAISADAQGYKTQEVVGSPATNSEPAIQYSKPFPAPDPLQRQMNVTPRPFQFAQPEPVKVQKQDDKMPQELLAILQSAFGSNSQSSSNSNCFGNREVACPSSSFNESYSTDSFSNARPTSASELKTPFKIVGTFKKYFDGCTEKAGLGSCKFVNLGVKGDASHQQRRSCHNSAQAIDVGPLTCIGGQRVLASDPKYFSVASCMANQTNNELQVIFYKTEGPNMMRKSDHNNHMHIQLKNCAMVFG